MGTNPILESRQPKRRLASSRPLPGRVGLVWMWSLTLPVVGVMALGLFSERWQRRVPAVGAVYSAFAAAWLPSQRRWGRSGFFGICTVATLMLLLTARRRTVGDVP